MKPENEMTDEELEEWERQTRIEEDRLDKLELLRRALNDSRVEQMYVIKRASKLGNTCPYYIKARELFTKDQQAEILSLLVSIIEVEE